ncbi:MAG: hypothetical protein GY756_27490, partial [bacterium]|nr:hypothetical protein [bacterium]
MKNIFILILLISLSLISCGLEKLLSSGALIQGAKVGYEISTINKNSDFFLPETKYYIGRSVSAYILGRYDPCITEQYSQLINYIKKIGHTLAMASDYPET